VTAPQPSTGDQPVVAPTVSTDPERGPWHVSRIPSHLGRARTSTLVLSFLFLAIGTLYLNIRPEVPGTATTTTSETGVEQPAQVPATTSAPETTAEQTPETTAPRTTSAPTTSAEPTATDEPTATTTTPEETAETSVPTTSSAPSPSPAPTTVSPPG
jgi:hypothetical protein